jgi:hypothetical protein
MASSAITPAFQESKILLPGQTPDGRHILAVLLKRSYAIGPDGRCARLPQARLVSGDKHYGDPRTTPVQCESDLVPFKLATDVVVNAHAYAPHGRPVYTMECSVRVGQRRKTAIVTGDRICLYQDRSDPQFTEPEPFVEMPVTYDRAYGGVDIRSQKGMSLPYMRNPMGRGFMVKNTKGVVEGTGLPNIEDPQQLLAPETILTGDYKEWQRQPQPAGFGWFCKYWQPRAALAGVMPADRTFEQEMRKMYAQAVPAHQRELYAQTQLPDMNFQFFNGASDGLAMAPFLNGSEEIELRGLTPSGALMFHLPGERPAIGLDFGLGSNQPEVVLHTVMIHAQEGKVDLLWRGAAFYPGPDWLPQMKKLAIEVV